MTQEIFLGIDVSKARLDVCVSSEHAVWSVSNGDGGIDMLVQRLAAVSPVLVVLEATGSLRHLLVARLLAGGLPLAVVNPRQVWDFAKSLGQLAKTDALDARVLCRFGAAVRPAQRDVPDAAAQDFADQLGRRRQLVEMLVVEKVRLKQSHNREVRRDLKAYRVAGEVVARQRCGPAPERRTLARLAGQTRPAAGGRGLGPGDRPDLAGRPARTGPTASRSQRWWAWHR